MGTPSNFLIRYSIHVHVSQAKLKCSIDDIMQLHYYGDGL